MYMIVATNNLQKACGKQTEHVYLHCRTEQSQSPSLVTIFAQHDVAGCDIHMCHITCMEAVHCP